MHYTVTVEAVLHPRRPRERFNRQLYSSRMMSEQQHLRLLRELGQDFDSSACAGVIEVDKNVVKHKRHGLLRREMLLNAREPQRKKELVECPVAEGPSHVD